jgi:hypothetical protein
VALTDGVIHFPVERRFCIIDNMLSEAEWEICHREIPEEDRRGWTDAEAAQSVEPELAAGGAIEDFVVDMRGLIAEKRPVAVPKFVARESWATTAYRFTLLALAGGRMEVTDAPAEAAGPGRILATLPVDVEFDHTKRDMLDGEFATELTAGWIVPRPETASAEPVAPESEEQHG